MLLFFILLSIYIATCVFSFAAIPILDGMEDSPNDYYDVRTVICFIPGLNVVVVILSFIIILLTNNNQLFSSIHKHIYKPLRNLGEKLR